MTRTIVVMLLAFASASAAQAGLELGQRPIARTEVTAVAKKQFAEMDVNHDGFVNPDEFERYREIQNAQPDRAGASPISGAAGSTNATAMATTG